MRRRGGNPLRPPPLTITGDDYGPDAGMPPVLNVPPCGYSWALQDA